MDNIKKETTEKIYRPVTVGLAAFLGSPVAGGILMRTNFLAAGDTRKANAALFISVLLTILLFAFPDDLPSSFYTIVNTILSVGYIQIAKHYFNDQVVVRENNKELFFSNWRAVGIALITAAIVFALVMGYYLLSGQGFE